MAETPPEQADLRSLLAQVIEELAQLRRVQDEMRRAHDEHIRIQEARLVALELRNENLEAEIQRQHEVIRWALGLDTLST